VFPNLTGKTVAIVGPAEAVGDQSAEVEACDYIIRTNHRWRNFEALTGFGGRTDAVFLSVMGAEAVKNQMNVLSGIDWVIQKHGGPDIQFPRVVKADNPFSLANQVPILLNFLEPYNPAAVWVFGADFYTGGPDTFQQPQYRNPISLEEHWSNLNKHDQGVNHQWVKAFQDRTGLIQGDSRMVELLSLTTEEVLARLFDAWRTVHGQWN
jgi:hypothetical protein